MNQEKFQHFLENARLLGREFGIVPLLYGSLGLEYRINEDLGADDIDILIPRELLTERWQAYQVALQARGYVLVDEHEHTFVRDGVAFSYAEIEDLEPFAGIRTEDIEIRETDGVPFLLLSLEQYLRVYQKSSRDGYRVNVRQKKDHEKIRFLERELAKTVGENR